MSGRDLLEDVVLAVALVCAVLCTVWAIGADLDNRDLKIQLEEADRATDNERHMRENREELLTDCYELERSLRRQASASWGAAADAVEARDACELELNMAKKSESVLWEDFTYCRQILEEATDAR